MTAPAMTFAIKHEYIDGYFAGALHEAKELELLGLSTDGEAVEKLIEAGLIYSRLASRAATHARYEDDELRRAALEELSRWMRSHASTCEGLAFDLQMADPRKEVLIDS